jgi:pyruvate dehydrogenase E2 component (dihydrolipoamide acetyltransferase)
MAKQFKLPDPGEGIHEAEILEIYVSEGDEVQEGDIILHIETDKAAVEVPSPFTGVIEEIRVKPGDLVQVGEVLVTFSEQTAQETGRKKSRQPQEKEADEKARDQAKAVDEEIDEEETEEEEESKKEPRSKVAAATKSESQEKPKEEPEEEKKEPRAQRTTDGPVPASPATRRLARELGVELQTISGSGPGRRVTAEDVRTAADETEKAPKREKPEKEQEAKPTAAREREAEAPAERTPERRPKRPLLEALPPLPDFSRWGPVEHVPLRSIRRATARRMAMAWSQIPHVTHQDIADITELEAFRRRHQEAVEEQNGQLSLTVFVMQAVVAALKQFPRFNASLDPDAGELILKQYYHIGIAVDAEQGLLVPVIRDVDRKSLTELATELGELVERVRQKETAPADMRGGTFTITNPGPIGGTAFTPIINYPEVAILGLARARLEPVVEGDLDKYTMVPRLRLPLHLAFDHRVNDGADAARFLRAIIDILSDPESFILNV